MRDRASHRAVGGDRSQRGCRHAQQRREQKVAGGLLPLDGAARAEVVEDAALVVNLEEPLACHGSGWRPFQAVCAYLLSGTAGRTRGCTPQFIKGRGVLCFLCSIPRKGGMELKLAMPTSKRRALERELQTFQVSGGTKLKVFNFRGFV
jgi:hypothetical protein